MDVRKLQDLIPYDKNPRKNQKAIEHVLNSLRKHGQVKPIVISAVGHPFNNEVICAGHTTLCALQEFGAKEAQVKVHEFRDEAEFIDYNIRDNKTSEFAEFDEDMVVQLGAEFDVDLTEMGFAFSDDDSYVLDEEEEEEEDDKPRKSDDDHSAFEVIMNHEEKLKFIKFLNEIRQENELETLSDTLVHLMENWK